ncbi:NAD(P)-binding protein [Sistotremastrum suecicum HHB10207 ss-3]|uniref:NAD(P)-binding protein n=1 Tax=Sistotremastrum suecicum HHB10207 ss-3 TaxID=1314776 RepID=A0A166AAE6_9AGAM|nr:NAD(P)-binding protein [Sistotremastrum suecicum HHB10207 ss-3]
MNHQRVAIITGASSGIGRITAITLSAAGWKLGLSGRRTEKLEETAKECKSETIVIPSDVSKEDDVRTLFEKTVERFGRLDMLFNNAGISSRPVNIDELSLETFRNVLDVNVVGSFLCAREAMKLFKAQSPPGGRIINNGSLAAHTPRPQALSYTTSKHAITGLTKSIALDGRAFNITCTQIDIGNALTEMAAGQAKGILQPDGSIRPEATFDVQHVADTVLHIASLPNDVAVLTITIMAAKAPYVGRG